MTNTKSNCSHACVGCEIRECGEGSRNTIATLRELLKANNNSPCACSLWAQLQEREENRSRSYRSEILFKRCKQYINYEPYKFFVLLKLIIASVVRFLQFWHTITFCCTLFCCTWLCERENKVMFVGILSHQGQVPIHNRIVPIDDRCI